MLYEHLNAWLADEIADVRIRMPGAVDVNDFRAHQPPRGDELTAGLRSQKRREVAQAGGIHNSENPARQRDESSPGVTE